MEHSAYEAIMIGVNVTIFIIALSAAVILMANVLDMVNYANESAKVGMNGTLAESVGVVEDRVYTGEKLLTYYRKQNEINEQGESQSNYDFKVKLRPDGAETSLKTFVEAMKLQVYLNQEFILEYKGEISGKHTYVFVKK